MRLRLAEGANTWIEAGSDEMDQPRLRIARRLRIPTWLIAGWTLLFGLFVVGDLLSPGAPDALAFFWVSSAPVSMSSWAIGAAPLGVLWYATRPGVPRVRIALAVLVMLGFLWVLMVNRQWSQEPPSLATGVSEDLGVAPSVAVWSQLPD